MSKKSNHLAGLNKNQLLAASHRQGEVLVNAGAGTGKTKTLVARYLSLLLDSEQPAKVGEILTITYTSAGADEIKQRVRAELHMLGHAECAAQMNQAWISTFHGFCSRVLHRHALEAGIDPHFRSDDEIRTKALQDDAYDELIRRLVSECEERDGAGRVNHSEQSDAWARGQLTFDDYMVLRETWSDFTVRKNTFTIYGKLRQMGMRQFDVNFDVDWHLGQPLLLSKLWQQKLLIDDQQDSPNSPSVGTIFLRFVAAFAKIYEQLCFERSTLDFNEQLLAVRDLLYNERILRELQSQFAYTMVDEVQDTNALQMEIIAKIAGANLYLVGDTKQSIYGFQGADVAVIQTHQKNVADRATIFELNYNYRSDEDILSFTNALFGNEELLGYAAPQLTAHKKGHKDKNHGKGVSVCEISPIPGTKFNKDLAAKAEAKWIVDQFEAERSIGRPLSDFAVLVQKRKHGKPLLEELARRGIPAMLRGGQMLLDAPIVKDALSFIDVLGKPRDPELFLKVLVSPMGWVSDKGIYELGKLRRKMNANHLWDAALQAVEQDTVHVLSDKQDQQALAGLVACIERGRFAIGARPLSEIVGRALSEREVDLHYLLQGRLMGRQALANLQQLLRLMDDWQDSGKNPLLFASELRQQKKLGLKIQQDVVSMQGEECIAIDTIHSSKGREYPVVALPLALSLSAGVKRNALVLHQLAEGRSAEQGGEVALAIGDCVLTRRDSNASPEYKSHLYDELHKHDMEKEQMEAIRLLYVACTRAEDKLLAVYSNKEKSNALSDAMVRGMAAAASEMRRLQAAKSLTIEQIEVGNSE